MARKPKLTDEQLTELFLDYCSNMSYKELAAKYGVSEGYLGKMVHEQGWVERKRQSKELALNNIQNAYVDASQELVDRYFSAGYKLLCLWEEAMKENGGGLLDKQGNFSQFKLEKAVSNIVAIKAFLDECTGVMSYKEAMELQLKYEQNELKKAIAGLGGDDNVQDNFMEMMQASLKRLAEKDDD